MSRSEHIQEALRNFTPPHVKKGDTYTIEDLRPFFPKLVELANEDRESMNRTTEEMGEKVRATAKTPITASEVENVCERYDYWICYRTA